MIRTILLIILIAVIGLTSPLLWMLSFNKLGAWAIVLWLAVILVFVWILTYTAGSSDEPAP